VFNFIPQWLALDNFIELHGYLDGPFREATGTGLEEFLNVLWAISNIALIPNLALSKPEDFGPRLLQLLRRGYSVRLTNMHSLEADVLNRLKNHRNLSSAKLSAVETAAPSALMRVTLTPDQQQRISPWSGGPRPVIIPAGDSILIDTVGILNFVSRMFTGIHDEGTTRGKIFEHTVRDSITKMFEDRGFKLGPRKLYNDGVLVDEIDLMLEKDERVYVCECFSMWLPLNFEIGDEKTIQNRLEQIDKKIDQANQTCEYLKNNRVGANYDYTAVNEFIPIVVSPFVEWLPNTSSRYWISRKHPRVMSVDELVRYLEEKD
jgi:hypothetical protein